MRTLLCSLLALLALSAHAQTVDEVAVFSAANAAYQSGDYQKAADTYRRLVDGGLANADVYFNLGTAEFKAGRRGQAILAFERALKLDPYDQDAAFNLAEAQRGNIDKMVGTREEEPLVERIGQRVPAELVGTVFLGCWVGALLLLALRRWAGRARGLLGWVASLALVAAGVSGLLLGTSWWQQEHARYAVVVAPSTPVREGPAADFKPAFEVHEGLKVRVVRSERGFSRVRLPNGLEGWVADKDAPRI